MSNVYYTEPPTLGKILLKTTVGDVEIELFSREIPKACKNFINLCLAKYYNGTIFHRVVKGFIVQGGDPTGTGGGGESYDGSPFPDEFHQRLKFSRRGLVAMANAGPNDNRSQFFITLAPCMDLQNKNTIFGTVVNNTIFNVLKMEEMDVDSNDRPIYPPRILKTIDIISKVKDNPFKDTGGPSIENKKKQELNDEAFKHVKAIKNSKLLSFEDENEETFIPKKIMSLHDAIDDPHLSKRPEIELDNIQTIEKQKYVARVDLKSEQPVTEVKETTEDELDKIKAQQEQLKQFLKSTKRKIKEMKNKQNVEENDEIIDENALLTKFGPLRKDFTTNETISEYILSNHKYAKRKKILPILNKSDNRELLTLNLLKNFQSQLSDYQREALIKRKERCGDTEPDIEIDSDWMNHMLAFDKPSPYVSQAFDANVETVDRYDITDPRNPMNLRKRSGAH